MKENNLASILALAFITILVMLTIVLLAWLSAVTLTWLWAWFIVPFGVTQLSLAHAFGISGIVYYLTYRPATNEIDKEQGLKALAQAVMLPFVALGMGYIYQLFM